MIETMPAAMQAAVDEFTALSTSEVGLFFLALPLFMLCFVMIRVVINRRSR